jgi:hypothetical protein
MNIFLVKAGAFIALFTFKYLGLYVLNEYSLYRRPTLIYCINDANVVGRKLLSITADTGRL